VSDHPPTDRPLLLTALAKLPPVGGIVMRGLDGGDVPALGVLTDVVTGSRKIAVATENFTAPTLLVLLSRTGRDLAPLSAYHDDDEVALVPGSAWRRLPDPVVDQITVVALEEVDPAGYRQPTGWPQTLADLTRKISELVCDARSTEPVVVTRPGQFTGPWPTRSPEDAWADAPVL